MTETEIRKAFIKRFELVANITRIETGSTEVGVPDLHVRTDKADLWIELKIATGTAREMRVEYRAGQQRWAENHKSLLGLVCLLVYHGGSYYFFEHFNDKFNWNTAIFDFVTMKTASLTLLNAVIDHLMVP